MALETVILVRHSKAEGAHPDGDSSRALSSEGRRRIADLVPQLDPNLFHPEVAVSSPYLRARQTREGFASQMPDAEWRESSAWLPHSDAEDAWLDLVDWEAEGLRSVAVFTHNPLVAAVAELLLPHEVSHTLVFHTPTFAAIGFSSGLGRGTGRLLWTLHP